MPSMSLSTSKPDTVGRSRVSTTTLDPQLCDRRRVETGHLRPPWAIGHRNLCLTDPNGLVITNQADAGLLPRFDLALGCLQFHHFLRQLPQCPVELDILVNPFYLPGGHAAQSPP